jgi:hypothetical protein
VTHMLYDVSRRRRDHDDRPDAADVRGINDSLDLIRETRGRRCPAGPVTEEDYVDLVRCECEFRDQKSFTFWLLRSPLPPSTH